MYIYIYIYICIYLFSQMEEYIRVECRKVNCSSWARNSFRWVDCVSHLADLCTTYSGTCWLITFLLYPVCCMTSTTLATVWELIVVFRRPQEVFNVKYVDVILCKRVSEYLEQGDKSGSVVAIGCERCT